MPVQMVIGSFSFPSNLTFSFLLLTDYSCLLQICELANANDIVLALKGSQFVFF